MVTIKSFTSLEQSKKLAEILPIESADMCWSRCTITDFGDGVLKVSYAVEPCNISQFRNTKEDIPCWSLAALLCVLPDTITSNDGIAFKLNIKKSIIEYSNPSLYLIYKSVKADNPVDACVAMIEKLHELNLL